MICRKKRESRKSGACCISLPLEIRYCSKSSRVPRFHCVLSTWSRMARKNNAEYPRLVPPESAWTTEIIYVESPGDGDAQYPLPARRRSGRWARARARFGFTRAAGGEDITRGRLKSRSSAAVCRACRLGQRAAPRIPMRDSSFFLLSLAQGAIFPATSGPIVAARRNACKIMLMHARPIGYWQSRDRPRLAGPVRRSLLLTDKSARTRPHCIDSS